MFAFKTQKELSKLSREERIRYFNRKVALEERVFEKLSSVLTELTSDDADYILVRLETRKKKILEIKKVYSSPKFLNLRKILRKLFEDSVNIVNLKTSLIIKRLNEKKIDENLLLELVEEEKRLKDLSHKIETDLCELCHEFDVDAHKYLFTYKVWKKDSSDRRSPETVS